MVHDCLLHEPPGEVTGRRNGFCVSLLAARCRGHWRSVSIVSVPWGSAAPAEQPRVASEQEEHRRPEAGVPDVVPVALPTRISRRRRGSRSGPRPRRPARRRARPRSAAGFRAAAGKGGGDEEDGQADIDVERVLGQAEQLTSAILACWNGLSSDPRPERREIGAVVVDVDAFAPLQEADHRIGDRASAAPPRRPSAPIG